jgi:N-acetylglutamate synthase-like GNAT family acetyltransferase
MTCAIIIDIQSWMNSIRIEELLAPEARRIVTQLYEREGNGIDIRETDRFFVAFLDDEVAGSVRFCVEENTPMLRTMRVAEKFQGHGCGLKLLRAFAAFLDQNQIRDVFCLPYAHLEKFYGEIGFQTIDEKTAPAFLRERLRKYREKPGQYLCMKREGRKT